MRWSIASSCSHSDLELVVAVAEGGDLSWADEGEVQRAAERTTSNDGGSILLVLLRITNEEQ
jgi:hypothetical protein